MMKFKYLYFLVVVILFSIIGYYIYVDNKFQDSNIRTYKMKKEEFLNERYEGYIYEIIKGVKNNQKIVTIILNDGSNRVYDICSDDLNLREKDIIKKKKYDKYLYINNQPVELYKFICNPN